MSNLANAVKTNVFMVDGPDTVTQRTGVDLKNFLKEESDADHREHIYRLESAVARYDKAQSRLVKSFGSARGNARFAFDVATSSIHSAEVGEGDPMRLLSRALYASGETTILLNDVSIHLAELIEAHDRLMYHYQELRFMEIEYNAGTSYQDDEEARENSIRDQFEHDEEDVPGVPRSKSKAGAR